MMVPLRKFSGSVLTRELMQALSGPSANGVSQALPVIPAPDGLHFRLFSPSLSGDLSAPPRIEGEDDPNWVERVFHDVPPGPQQPGGTPPQQSGVTFMDGHCVVCGRDAANIPSRITVDSVAVEFCPGHMARPVFEVLMQLATIRYNAQPITPPQQQ